MKILITGGLGHIGSYFLENIYKIKNIKKIYIIDNLSTNRYCSLFNLKNSKNKIYFYQKDLSKKNSLKDFKKVDVVINLASLTNAEQSIKIKNFIYKNNLGIFNNVINYCIKNSTKLIHFSSTSVYGEQKGLVNENCDNLLPKSPYAEIKVKEENILMKNKNKIKFVIYRFGTISGFSQGMRFHTAINKFCLYAVLGKSLPIWESMMNKHRPYLSLKDAFKTIKFTIENNFFNKNIYNIVSQNLTLKEILSYFRKNKKKIKIKFVKSKLINQFSYKVSNKKFTKDAILLNSSIKDDIKITLRKFKSIKNEM